MDEADRPEPVIPPAEAARLRRRDRERSAKTRELMRTGQAKAFKQILDVQARRAAEAPARAEAEPGQGRGRAPRTTAKRSTTAAERDDVTGSGTD